MIAFILYCAVTAALLLVALFSKTLGGIALSGLLLMVAGGFVARLCVKG